MSNDFFSNAKKNKYVKDYLEQKLFQYGEIKYVYAVMNKANTDKMMIISNLPDSLVVNYLNNKTQNIDPVIISSLNRVSSFFWDENMKINSQWTMKRVFDPVKPYNIISGYVFVLHDHKNNLAVLSLYIDKYLMEDVGEIINNNKNELQVLLICIHDMLIHAYCENNTNDSKTLTSRESEVLYLCATGKTYSEISDLLYISVSTVKFHMSKVIKKLGVRNAKQAISLSSELNIASPQSGRVSEGFN